ncbi:flavodoxin domain-containing protein [Amycolatopsis sp. NPDC006131]|uniref:flavodoxin domain-containing protein n=1 Tax=Amycolatopsis sp. NPDC006131 TaxID=3156731 RepID=UPI0033B3A6F7
MRALVVYESMFGSTEDIAREIAKGLSAAMQVEVTNVDDAPEQPEGFDLVVAGGPTHVHGMSRASTRESARKQAVTDIRSRSGLREWMDGLAPPTPGTRAATFDTRIDKPAWLVGSAAHGAAKGLRRKGYALAAEPASFFVDGAEPGDLHAGERERAREWGASLAGQR